MQKLHWVSLPCLGVLTSGIFTVGCGASAGAEGSAFGGHTASGTGGAATGEGGAGGGTDPLAIGPGIPTDGDAYCLADMPPGTELSFDDVRRCIIGKKIDGPATDAEKMDFCPRVGGIPISACPVTDTPVAYCKLLYYARPGIGQIPFDVTAVIEMSPVSPSAAAVIREQAGTYERWCEGETYDTSNHHVTATCGGTLSASVDGVPTDFSFGIRCSFVADGDRALFQVSGNVSNSAQSPFLALTVSKEGTQLSLTSPVEYIETDTATDTGGTYYPPTDGSSLSYQSETFDASGAALSGTFSFGTTMSKSGATRLISAGHVNVTFPVQ